MAWLALDASTEACAVGIQTEGNVVFEAFEVAPRRHTELLPKMLDSVIADADVNKQAIQGCIVGIGPGAFTGIRVGLATIQGIALGLNIPCFPISSLHAIAQQTTHLSTFEGKVLATIDARMGEIYCAEYSVTSKNKTSLTGEESLIANDQFVLPLNCTRVVGSGVSCIENSLDSSISIEKDCYPTASALFAIFNQNEIKPVRPEQLQASYIRNNVTYQNNKTS